MQAYAYKRFELFSSLPQNVILPIKLILPLLNEVCPATAP